MVTPVPASVPEGVEDVGWRAAATRASKNVVRHRVTMSAGSLAYHWFLSMFPAVIAILGFLALVQIAPHGVT